MGSEWGISKSREGDSRGRGGVARWKKGLNKQKLTVRDGHSESYRHGMTK